MEPAQRARVAAESAEALFLRRPLVQVSRRAVGARRSPGHADSCLSLREVPDAGAGARPACRAELLSARNAARFGASVVERVRCPKNRGVATGPPREARLRGLRV